MQTALEIECQDTVLSSEHQKAIARQVEKLENRFGRVTSCRVVVKGPGGRHQTGGLYDINIRLALPNGREVNVGRTATADERHADLSFAISDAFKRARRQLEDQVQRMDGDIKSHAR